MTSAHRSHPWMANSAPGQIEAMLSEIGASSARELFEQIPEDHFRKTPLDLPPTLISEADLRRDLVTKLAKNENCETHLSFLGAGAWQHHVPGVVDEIVTRTEFSTNVWGSPQSDVGRNQAWFEFNSQLGALLNMDVVQLPVYSWGCAAGHAIRMAARMTGRNKVLVSEYSDPERLAVIRSYCEPPEMESHIDVVAVACDPATGRINLDDLEAKLGDDVAALYFENPAYLGPIETEGAKMAAAARAAGAETIVGADPLSLGILMPPADYGADIVVGPTQPLGIHMNGGGGVGGYIASHDVEKYVRQYNGFLVSMDHTVVEGQYAFNLACAGQNSYGLREKANDWTGNSVYLWAVANAVYMSLLGPEGFREIGELILARARYAADKLSSISGVEVKWAGTHFKEFVVSFDGTGKNVSDINDALRERGIFGGKDLSAELPGLGQSALYCVTEIHTAADIDRLAATLEEVL
ncbi:MAG: aminomethyl-transferring glycine dehydrogenase subunit GcvPA [Paracoccaceae bacterium]|nr:aminomethyl-transferring glycine dehydrogenase subunit GcvPA [Paracoccaceae bacterium]